MRNKRISRLGAACLGVATACGAAAARASEPAPVQVAPAPAPVEGAAAPIAIDRQAPDAAPAPQVLAEVVVTATKRKKSLRDIPASIDEFSGDKLEAQGKTNLSDYLSEAPGVTMNQVTPSTPRISIRGISTDTSGVSAQPSPTGILIGDVAFTDPYISGMQPDLSAFDLTSVEVLKGPQGTLFGGAALAGAIRYVLQDPQPGQWHARAFSQERLPDGGSAALTSGVALNIPLYQDSLTARLDYVNQHYPGVTDILRDPPQYNVDHGSGEQYRGALLWQPLDALKLKFTHLSQNYASPNGGTTATDSSTAHTTDEIILPQPVNTRFGLDTLDAEYEFSDVRLVSLSSYSTKNEYIFADGTYGLIGTPPQGYPPDLGAFLVVTADSHAFTQELRLQSTGSGGFQWLVGAYLYNYSLHFLTFSDTVAEQNLLGHGPAVSNILDGLQIDPSALFNKASLLYAVSDVTAQESALFFDLDDKFWDRLDVSLGARIYSTEEKGGFFLTGLLTDVANNGQDINYTGNHLRETGVSPKATATWKYSRDISQYVQVSRGFRFGGLQSIPPTITTKVPQQYKSDTLWNYETGLRTAWLHNKLHFDLTAFYDFFKNPQIRQSTTGLVMLPYTDNVAGAISRGLETSLRWLTPLPGLELDLSGALTDAHTTEPFTASDGSKVSAGLQMPGAARTQYSAGLSYLVPIDRLLLGSTVDYNYIGKGQSNIIDQVPINDYGTLSAGLSLAAQFGEFKPMLTFNASNILNKVAVVGGGTSKTTLQMPLTNYQLNAPRTYVVRLSMDF